MITQMVRELLGNVPSAGTNYDYSILEYVISGSILIFLLFLSYRMLTTIFGRYL